MLFTSISHVTLILKQKKNNLYTVDFLLLTKSVYKLFRIILPAIPYVVRRYFLLFVFFFRKKKNQ